MFHTVMGLCPLMFHTVPGLCPLMFHTVMAMRSHPLLLRMALHTRKHKRSTHAQLFPSTHGPLQLKVKTLLRRNLIGN